MVHVIFGGKSPQESIRSIYLLLLLLLWFICRPPIKDIVLALAGLFGFLIYLLAVLVGDAIWDCRRSFFFFFFLFFPPLLSGPYLWNCYLQRLQIECAAWSCCPILHYSLPSNSLLLFFIFLFFCQNFVRAISLEPLLAETPN